MKNHSKYERDMFEGYVTIHEATETLAMTMPTEMITAVLLLEVIHHLGGFSDLEQWEVVKSELLEIRDEFIGKTEPHWSNLIDLDKVAELYNKRYA